jgi:hypothetical protein
VPRGVLASSAESAQQPRGVWLRAAPAGTSKRAVQRSTNAAAAGIRELGQPLVRQHAGCCHCFESSSALGVMCSSHRLPAMFWMPLTAAAQLSVNNATPQVVTQPHLDDYAAACHLL